MKLCSALRSFKTALSHPTRGAWIEMFEVFPSLWLY